MCKSNRVTWSRGNSWKSAKDWHVCYYFVIKLSVAMSIDVRLELSQFNNPVSVSRLLSVQLAKVSLRVESRSLSWWQSHREVGHSRRVARRCWVAVRPGSQRSRIVLLHRTIYWLQIRCTHPEDRNELQGIHVSMKTKTFANRNSNLQPLSLFMLRATVFCTVSHMVVRQRSWIRYFIAVSAFDTP